MSIDILKTRVKENKLSGVFLFCGAEEYMKDHYSSILRKNVDSSPLPEFNHLYFDASSGELSELSDLIDSVPYMWETKLVEIKGLENARIPESDIEDYERIFSEIPDYVTVLIVVRGDEKIEEIRNDKTKQKDKSGINALINVVKEHGLVVEFNNEKADKLVSWIVRHLNANGVKYEMNVPREIINVCGSDMYILQGEIKKLSEVYDEKAITASDVKKYCCANSAFKYFDLADALNRRDIVAAKKIFESLNLKREEISFAIGTIARVFGEMLVVKTAIDSGKRMDAVAKDLNKQQWQINKTVQSVSKTDVRTLSYTLKQLYNADARIKSLRGNPYRILEWAFYRICNYGRKA